MEKYMTNRSCARPYHTTCGMNRTSSVQHHHGSYPRREEMREEICGEMRREMPGEMCQDVALAMTYVPLQKLGKTFDLCKALQVGTIFPELCKPFCGKRGGCA